MLPPKVLDLSHHNPIGGANNDQDYEAGFTQISAAGILGIIHKATQGTRSIDVEYARRREAAIEAGLLWGAYHFADASNPDDQAEHFLAVAKPGDETLIALDYEPLAGNTMTLAGARRFLQNIENAMGRKAVLYSGNLIKQTMKRPDEYFNSHRLWLAQYGPAAKLPVGWGRYWLWQFSDKGGFPGVTGNVDKNAFDGDFQQLADEWSA